MGRYSFIFLLCIQSNAIICSECWYWLNQCCNFIIFCFMLRIMDTENWKLCRHWWHGGCHNGKPWCHQWRQNNSSFSAKMRRPLKNSVYWEDLNLLTRVTSQITSNHMWVTSRSSTCVGKAKPLHFHTCWLFVNWTPKDNSSKIWIRIH